LEEVIAKAAAGTYSSTAATTWDATYYSTNGYRGAHGQKMMSTTATAGQATIGTSNTSANGGFDARLAGAVQWGDVAAFATESRHWVSSSHSETIAFNRRLKFDQPGCFRTYSGKTWFMSVRCKKD
jgi:hypothetical protein